jgi:hypothetical protein
MAEERDPQVSRRYRELGSEEPPHALDEAILAASRRAASSRRGWYVPLAAAAVALLAVGIAVHVEREQPEMEAATAPSEVKEAPAEVKPAPRSEPAPRLRKREAARDLARQAPAAPPQDGAAGPEARNERQFGFSAEQAPAPASRAARVDAVSEAPERILERIAELRKQGRHDEADKALAEFKKRYPDYRIPESVLK